MQTNLHSGDPLSLDRIRTVLTRLEDTIIFSLIERAQFAHNPRIYQKGYFKELKDLDFPGSWLDWFLKETESFHGNNIHFIPIHGPYTHFTHSWNSILVLKSSSQGETLHEVRHHRLYS